MKRIREWLSRTWFVDRRHSSGPKKTNARVLLELALLVALAGGAYYVI